LGYRGCGLLHVRCSSGNKWAETYALRVYTSLFGLNQPQRFHVLVLFIESVSVN